jgi:hypothetical protein
MARGWIREVQRNLQLSLNGAPLGRLHDVRQALPEGYQDPYIENWDGAPDQVEEDDIEDLLEEEDQEQEENEEEEQDDSNNDQGGVGEEDDTANENVRLQGHSRYSPLRTRSGRVRN